MNNYQFEKLKNWCFALGILFLFTALGMYFHFSSQITHYKLAYRDQHFLMPPTNDEMDKYMASKNHQEAIEDQYRANHPQLFKLVEERDFVFDKILANVPDRVFYEDHSDYLLPYFIDADDWVAFKLEYISFAKTYQAFVQDMKTAEYKLPEGHNPPKPVLRQMIADAELTLNIWVGLLLVLGIICLLFYWGLNKPKEDKLI